MYDLDCITKLDRMFKTTACPQQTRKTHRRLTDSAVEMFFVSFLRPRGFLASVNFLRVPLHEQVRESPPCFVFTNAIYSFGEISPMLFDLWRRAISTLKSAYARLRNVCIFHKYDPLLIGYNRFDFVIAV